MKADDLKAVFERDAAHAARLAARPEKPEGYELKFPEGFTPEVAIRFDDNDPRLADMRTFAHELGWDQATFSRALQLEAARVVAEAKAYQAAVDGEKQKLGANAAARVDAIRNWLKGHVGAAAADDLLGTNDKAGLLIFSAAAIEHIERLQHALTTQGGAPFTQQHRDNVPPPPPKTRAEILFPTMKH